MTALSDIRAFLTSRIALLAICGDHRGSKVDYRFLMPRQIRTKPPAARDVIVELARQTKRPLDEVESVYEQQLDILESYATVKAFVPVFAKRRAREVLAQH